MSVERSWQAVDEGELARIAASFSRLVGDGGVIHLEGDLGAGKTTFARALLKALGVGERIKSPTYSLIESYQVGSLNVHHLDLYRIADPDELEWLGLGDLVDGPSLLLIEWPKRGEGALPTPDLELNISHAGERRNLHAKALSSRASVWISALES